MSQEEIQTGIIATQTPVTEETSPMPEQVQESIDAVRQTEGQFIPSPADSTGESPMEGEAQPESGTPDPSLPDHCCEVGADAFAERVHEFQRSDAFVKEVQEEARKLREEARQVNTPTWKWLSGHAEGVTTPEYNFLWANGVLMVPLGLHPVLADAMEMPAPFTIEAVIYRGEAWCRHEDVRNILASFDKILSSDDEDIKDSVMEQLDRVEENAWGALVIASKDEEKRIKAEEEHAARAEESIPSHSCQHCGNNSQQCGEV